jgi:hypothetical protein
MASLTPDTSSWDATVTQLETTDIVIGGAGGKSNEAHQELTNRTEYIFDALFAAGTPLATAVDLQIAGATDANLIFIDASQDNIGFGKQPTSGYTVEIAQKTAGSGNLRLAGDLGTEGGQLIFADKTDTDAWNLDVFSDDTFRIFDSSAQTYFTVGAAPGITSFNTSKQNQDFQVRGDTADNVIYVDASQDNTGFGRAPSNGVTVDIAQISAAGGNLRLSGDFSGATEGGQIMFADKTDTDAYYFDVDTDGDFRLIDLATSNAKVEFGSTDTIFNNAKNDINFRVAGDTDDNLLSIDAGNDNIGIGTAAASTRKLDITYSSAGGYTLVAANTSTTGAATAILGQSSSTDAVTVLGSASHASGDATGVKGKTVSSSTSSYGVYGESTSGISVGGNTAYNVASSKYFKISKRDVNILDAIRDNDLEVKQYFYEDSNYKGFNEFIGPMAQHIKDTFNLTFEDESVFSVDGIALGGVIELIKEFDKLKNEIKSIKEKM